MYAIIFWKGDKGDEGNKPYPYVRIFEPAIQEKCNGTLEVIPDDWERTIRRLENAG